LENKKKKNIKNQSNNEINKPCYIQAGRLVKVLLFENEATASCPLLRQNLFHSTEVSREQKFTSAFRNGIEISESLVPAFHDEYKNNERFSKPSLK